MQVLQQPALHPRSQLLVTRTDLCRPHCSGKNHAHGPSNTRSDLSSSTLSYRNRASLGNPPPPPKGGGVPQGAAVNCLVRNSVG